MEACRMTAEEIIQAMSKRGMRITGKALKIKFDIYGYCKDCPS
jgi:RNA polymerase-binding transcription factor DksA